MHHGDTTGRTANSDTDHVSQHGLLHLG
jgi:hypothetical protein